MNNGSAPVWYALRKLAQRKVRLGALLPLLWRWRIEIILGLGVLFRVAQYLADRPLWMDEGSIALNIERRPFSELFSELTATQLAPPGFLFVEWVAVRALGENSLALRLFPLVGGIAAVFLFYCVSLRVLRAQAELIAVGLFAVSDDLIYFASEVKQYETDVAAGLLCSLMALELASRPASVARLCAFGVAGATVLWFSHPSAFVLAGTGTVLIASALARREWRRAHLLALMSLLWAASFAGVYAVSLELLGHKRDMWNFWSFAFPPIPPSSLWDATWMLRRFLYLFINPLDFLTPLGPTLSALAAASLFLAGSASMARRDKRTFWMLVAPGLFALLAAYLQLYPFHGRLVLFLVPSLLLLIAEGTACVGEAAGSRTLWALLLGFLFLFSTLGAFYHLAQPRQRYGLNRYGDNRPTAPDPPRFPF